MFLNIEFIVPKSNPTTGELVKFYGENLISSKDEFIDVLGKYNESSDKHSAFFNIFFHVMYFKHFNLERDSSVPLPMLSYKDLTRDTTKGFYFSYFLNEIKKNFDRNDGDFSRILANIGFYAVIGGISAETVISSFVTWNMVDSCCLKAALLSEKGPNKTVEEFLSLINSIEPLELIAKSEKNEADGEEFYCFRNPSSDNITFVFSVSDDMNKVSGKMLVRNSGFEEDLCRTPLVGIVPKYIENILNTKDPVVYSSSMRCLVEVQKTDICFGFLIDRLLKDHYRFREDHSDNYEICHECHYVNSFSSDLILGLISEKYRHKANDVFVIANEAIRNGAPDSLILAMDLMCDHAKSIDIDVLKEFISLGSRRIENLLKEDHSVDHIYSVISTLNDIEGFGSHEKELALLLSNDSRNKIAIAGCDWYCNMIREDHNDIDLPTAQKLVLKSLYLITDSLREGCLFSDDVEHCFMELCRHIINSKKTGIDGNRMEPFVHAVSRCFVEDIAEDFSPIDFYGTSVPGLFIGAMSIYKECLNLEDLKVVALAFEKRDTNDYELFHDILTFLANDHRKILSGAEGQELISRFRSSVKSIHGLDAVTRVKMLATITMMNQQSCGIDRGKQ